MPISEKEFGAMQSTVQYTANAVDDIKGTLAETKDALDKKSETDSVFRQEIKASVAQMNERIVHLMEYKTKCEGDRVTVDSRIKVLEIHKSRQAGQMSVILALCVALGPIGAWLFDKLNLVSLIKG